MKKKLCAAVAVGAALFAAVVAPASASAATTPEAASSQTLMIGGRCVDYGYVRVNTAAVNVYTGAGTNYSVVKVAVRGEYLSCWPIIVGNTYRLCSNGVIANGWIPVDVLPLGRPDGVRDGYVPSTCVTD
ncbi:hypothetical protein Lfu02_75660 [Longispora fulva]|uniref:SH3 domain-containing protein n=1 Tax=Longispora fulva TaxID=619741 RepID=A0A8J7GHD6_9ACTN|nr:hypothetical protein [Longispora fulva]MBG6136298.1 hypothetical protein [Longispora fulva]GIG63194.1 hypothetical protein Lfu02_75660 [Longispora fulva]